MCGFSKTYLEGVYEVSQELLRKQVKLLEKLVEIMSKQVESMEKMEKKLDKALERKRTTRRKKKE